MLRLFDENGPNGSNDHACLQGHLPGDDLIDAREEGEEDGGEGGEGKEELALCLWGRDGREGVPNVDSVQFRDDVGMDLPEMEQLGHGTGGGVEIVMEAVAEIARQGPEIEAFSGERSTKHNVPEIVLSSRGSGRGGGGGVRIVGIPNIPLSVAPSVAGANSVEACYAGTSPPPGNGSGGGGGVRMRWGDGEERRRRSDEREERRQQRSLRPRDAR
jgi:hypothetical protein